MSTDVVVTSKSGGVEKFTHTESTHNGDWLYLWKMSASAGDTREFLLTEFSGRVMKSHPNPLIFLIPNNTTELLSPKCPLHRHTKGNSDDSFLSACFVPGLCS